MISIVVPTIASREPDLERTIAAYRERTGCEFELIVLRDRPTCAHAWNEGAKLAKGEFLHMTADDLEPETDEWWIAAIRACASGGVPLGWVREDGPAGTFGRDFARVPFCRTEWWRDVALAHYFSDNHFTDLMADQGHPVEIAPGYDFLHGRSPVGRDDSAARLARDEAVYRAARA